MIDEGKESTMAGKTHSNSDSSSSSNSSSKKTFSEIRLPTTPVGDMLLATGLSMRKIGAALKMDYTTIFDWVHGRSKPSRRSCKKIADFLGVAVDDVIDAVQRTPKDIQWDASKHTYRPSRCLRNMLSDTGLTTYEIAVAVGTSPSTVRRWMHCEVAPTERVHPKLAKLLGITVDELVEMLQNDMMDDASADDADGADDGARDIRFRRRFRPFRCAICFCPKPTVPEWRPTGEDGSMERWWYCEECWEENVELRKRTESINFYDIYRRK